MTQPTHAEIGDDAMGRHTQAAFLREIQENNSLRAQLQEARAERDASRQQVRACLQLRRQEQAAYQAGDQA